MHQFPLTLKDHGGDTKAGPGGCYAHTGFASDMRNSELRKSQSLKGCKQILLKLGPLGGHYLYYTGQQPNPPLPQRETLSLPLKAVGCANILEQIFWKKSCQCLCSQDMQYKYETHGELPPNNIAIKMYI